MADIPASTMLFPILALVAGLLAGWLLRSTRIRREKDAIHDGWKEQMAALKSEQDRVAEQNRSLMEQVSKYRASRKDTDARTRELSESLREALGQCEHLKVELGEARRDANSGEEYRTKLRAALEREIREQLREKDDKIFKLSRELESWQSRLPPLLEKYRERSLEVETLQAELETANERLADRERPSGDGETRVEPVEDAALAARMDASNEQFEDSGTHVDIELPADDGGTGVDTVLDTGTVDFDLGACSEAADEPDATDRTLTEVFEGDRTIVEVDEVLEAGETSVTDTVPLDPPSTPDQTGTQAHAGANGADDTRTNGATNGYPRDDLQQIKGVGPAIEKRLNALGIHSFAQIADMTEAEIDRVAQEMRDFRSRIYREDWMGQARTLQHDRTGQLH